MQPPNLKNPKTGPTDLGLSPQLLAWLVYGLPDENQLINRSETMPVGPGKQVFSVLSMNNFYDFVSKFKVA